MRARVKVGGIETVLLTGMCLGAFLVVRLCAAPKKTKLPLSIAQVDKLLNAVSNLSAEQRIAMKLLWVKYGMMEDV